MTIKAKGVYHPKPPQHTDLNSMKTELLKCHLQYPISVVWFEKWAQHLTKSVFFHSLVGWEDSVLIGCLAVSVPQLINSMLEVHEHETVILSDLRVFLAYLYKQVRDTQIETEWEPVKALNRYRLSVRTLPLSKSKWQEIRSLFKTHDLDKQQREWDTILFTMAQQAECLDAIDVKGIMQKCSETFGTQRHDEEWIWSQLEIKYNALKATSTTRWQHADSSKSYVTGPAAFGNYESERPPSMDEYSTDRTYNDYALEHYGGYGDSPTQDNVLLH